MRQMLGEENFKMPLDDPSHQDYNELIRTLAETAYGMDTPDIIKNFSSMIKGIVNQAVPKRTFSALRQLNTLSRNVEPGQIQSMGSSIRDAGNVGAGEAIRQRSLDVRSMFDKLVKQLVPMGWPSSAQKTVPSWSVFGDAAGFAATKISQMYAPKEKGVDLTTADTTLDPLSMGGR